MSGEVIDVSIIVVSYNTRELTLECLRSIHRETRGVRFELLVIDNASRDGSARAIAREFPAVQLAALQENLGFAGANNLGAEKARGRYLLLLNPDTVVLAGAIDRLVGFADGRPEAGIYGGRTRYADLSLNPTSCWARPTPWSLFCRAVGLSALFPRSAIFSPEGYGSWERDTVREVDIVSGCFFLIRRELWEAQGGFDPAFFMFGEEVDLCLRARREGWRPLICPEAEIIHFGGQSISDRSQKWVQMLSAKRRLAERHWPRWQHRYARAMLRSLVALRVLVTSLSEWLGVGSPRERAALFREVWRRRAEWLRPDAKRGAVGVSGR